MVIRAENDPRFTRKFLIMGLCLLGFAAYCMYDGLVGYPAKRDKGFAEYKAEKIQSQNKSLFTDERHEAMDLARFEIVADSEQRLDWEKYIEDRGIPSAAAVIMQFVMAAGCVIIGLILLSFPLRARGRWIELQDEGITSSWGESFHFDEVEELNKRQWNKKGIAKVTYVANGRRSKFVIDDLKFRRWPTDAIMYTLEQRIDPGRIVNGAPEKDPEGEIAAILESSRQNHPAANPA